MTYRPPLWVRALLAADHVAIRIQNVREALRDEVLLAWIGPTERASLTAALYADQSTYLPGGHRFQSGLFGWERRALDSPHFPKSGKILVGASGAGREVVALIERGFDVVAFDPCGAFSEAAARVAPTAQVFCASYDDLVRASLKGSATDGESSFSNALSATFDAVILGWGSLSHLTPFASRVALFHALRTLAPRAPVLTSFMLQPDSSAKPGSKGRVRDALRSAFSKIGAPHVSESGDHFYPDVGFFALFTRDELSLIGRETGYEVALFEDAPYPHAILLPIASSP